MTDASDLDQLRDHIRSFIFDQKHMTSRGLRFLHEKTGFDQYILAIFLSAITSVYLMVGHDAQTLANTILTITPILLTYIFPEEQPPVPQLLVYWSAFGLLTLLDSNFKPESGYYFIKVVLLALLFLHPFNGADLILQYIQKVSSDKFKDEIIKLDGPLSQIKLGDYSSPYDSADKHLMLSDPEFRIQAYDVTSAESLSINYSPHDLTFEPTKYLVFNAPFDFENLTYPIRIRNMSTKHIAFGIKSNALPRVFATPPCGILPPKKRCEIFVTINKTDKFNEEMVKNDRLAFDYVFCPPETKQFEFKLLKSEMRRRKNIYIKYNP